MSVGNSLVIEILKAVRNDTATLRTEMHAGFVDLAERTSRLERGVAVIRREAGLDAESVAHQQVLIDKMNARVERIERRLGLTEKDG